MGYLFRKEHFSIGAEVSAKEFIGLSWLQIDLGLVGVFSLEGTPGAESIFGTGRVEGIVGADGDDYLDAGGGDDMIYGGAGNDTIVGSVGDGEDIIDGGDDRDVLIYDDDTNSPISYNFMAGEVRRGGELDTFFNIERVIATDSTRDVIQGNANAPVTIDLLSGTAKSAKISMDISRFEFAFGGNDDDRLIGNNRANLLKGDDGNDMLSGGAGNDTLIGGLGDDTLKSGSGSDVLNGSFGDNDLADYSDEDAVTFNTATGEVTKASGVDTLLNIDVIRASTAGNDVLDASSQSSAVTLNLNTQTMSGTTSGITKIQDFEHLIGGSANDNLQGDAENNSITGGAGNDTINGRGGNDTMIMGVGHGNDSIDGSTGEDVVDYQTDTAAITFTSINSQVSDGTSTDNLDNVETIKGNASLQNVVSAAGESSAVTINLATQVLNASGDVEKLIGFWHIIGGNGNDTLTGDANNNSITGGQGNDTMSGGDGDDTFILGNDHGDDSITGGSGNDTVNYSSSSDAVTYDTKTGAANTADSHDMLSGIEVLIGGSGSNDKIDASDELSAVTINLGTNTLSGLTSGATSLQGFEHIIGGAGGDLLTGSSANNSITGGLGDDTLDGGAGNDTFIYLADSGNDVIADTTSGDSDVLDLTAYALSDVTAWHAVDGDDSGTELDSLQIILQDGNIITIQGYFDNSTTDMNSVAQGDGVMSSINFSGNSNQEFSDVVSLLS